LVLEHSFWCFSDEEFATYPVALNLFVVNGNLAALSRWLSREEFSNVPFSVHPCLLSLTPGPAVKPISFVSFSGLESATALGEVVFGPLSLVFRTIFESLFAIPLRSTVNKVALVDTFVEEGPGTVAVTDSVEPVSFDVSLVRVDQSSISMGKTILPAPLIARAVFGVLDA
jgi:hypothetical protein